MKSRFGVSVASIVLGAGLVLGACSTDHGGMEMDSGGSTSADLPAIPGDADFNATDVAFAQEMIVHHAQAIAMADIALDRTQNSDVRQLAEAIKAAQDPEIEQMRSWLAQWNQPSPDLSAGMDHAMDAAGGMTMGSMMSDADMNRLENSSGLDFDKTFLEMTIEHHEGAIDMAEQELSEGEYQPVKDLAQLIITAQTAEIEQMNALFAAV